MRAAFGVCWGCLGGLLRLLLVVGVVAGSASSQAGIAPGGDVLMMPVYVWSSQYGCAGYSDATSAATCAFKAQADDALAHGWYSWSYSNVSCVLSGDGTGAQCSASIQRCSRPNDATACDNPSLSMAASKSDNPTGLQCPAASVPDPSAGPDFCTCQGATIPSPDATSCQSTTDKNPDGSLKAAWPNGCKVGADSAWNGDVPVAAATVEQSMAPACVGGCVAQPFGSHQSAPGVFIVGAYFAVGGTCNSSSSTAGPPPVVDASPSNPQACQPAGGVPTCPGQVNGQQVCVPCGAATGTTGVTTSTHTNPDGSKTTTTTSTTTVDNGDGSVTTTTITTNGDGTATVTTSTQPKVPAGSTTGGSGSGQQQGDSFCTQNPQSPICKVSSFGGSCGAAFTCDGDAIQCAIAKEQHERSCSFFEPTGRDEGDKFTQAKSDGDMPSWSPANPANQASTSFDLSQKLDQSNPLGNACLQDESMTLVGVPVTLPWSQFCSSMQLAGRLIVAASLLIAGFIVFKT